MDKQKQRLIELAPSCTGISIIGMVQDPEDSDTICNAESAGLEPTEWDVLVRYDTDEVGNWEADDCSFSDYNSAYNFACELISRADSIELHSLEVI